MTPPAAGRQASVDLLRAIAIVLMVVVHFVENLSGWYGDAGGTFAGVHRVWWLPTGFAAPIFTFLSGVSYRLWLGVQQQRHRGEDAITKGTIRRGLFLIGLGFAFNVLIWLPQDVFNWDILTLIGGGLLALEAARRMPNWVVVFAAILIAAVSPAMRAVAGYADFWQAGYFDYEFSIAEVGLGWLVTGYFPVFPWLAYPLAGFGLAPWLLTRSRAGLLTALALGGTAVLLVLAWSGLPAVITGNAARAWTMFPASTAYLLGTLATVIAALAVLHPLLDPHPASAAGRGLMAWAEPLSRHALSIYLLHHAVHIWPLWAWGLATTGEPDSLWQVAMPVPWSLGLAAAFLLATLVLLKRLDRRRLPTAESLMRWLCD